LSLDKLGGKHRIALVSNIDDDLLQDDDRSIAEVARAAGFASQSHLTANFRRVTGLTSGRFRRSLD
jgi:AraC-like DNA-binding protein